MDPLAIDILVLEDHPADAELLVHALRRDGFSPTWRRAATRQAYLAALDASPDLILADYHLPDFDAKTALALLQERDLDIPLVVVTGAMGEEAGVACMRAGAADYLLKDRLTRLGPAVRRALEQHRARQERRAAVQELRRSEARYRSLVNAVPIGVFEVSTDGRILAANPAGALILGATTPEALVGKAILDFTSPAETDRIHRSLARGARGSPVSEGEIGLADGRIVSGLFIPVRAPTGEVTHLVGTLQDVTARRRAEEALERFKNKLEAENVYLQEEIRLTHNFEEIVGSSPPIQRALSRVELVAATEATVLILGETGTGKELFARAIHDRSRRRTRPLVKVNCAALAESLIENELFGHVRGAYTGAATPAAGRFELADGGTILLDEIGDVPLSSQAKLLRVLQEGEFERVGEGRTRKVDVRVIASTNRDLMRDVQAGRFRADLYYRLAVFPLELPALRERPSDLPMLVRSFATRFARKHGKAVREVPAADLELAARYPWPGNVRELENLVERAVILSSDGVIRLAPLLGVATPQVAAPAPTIRLDEVTAGHIRRVLDQVGWRIQGPGGAAEILGMAPSTLRSKMKRLGVDRS